jgi:hypothetical protein
MKKITAYLKNRTGNFFALFLLVVARDDLLPSACDLRYR